MRAALPPSLTTVTMIPKRGPGSTSPTNIAGPEALTFSRGMPARYAPTETASETSDTPNANHSTTQKSCLNQPDLWRRHACLRKSPDPQGTEGLADKVPPRPARNLACW
jgi:hypothetical protein